PAPNKPPPLEFEAVSDNQGAYRFPKVPPGKYTLQARGVFRNKLRETAVTVELDDQPDGRLQDLNLP
ncbi:MAG: carboxypeptidase-like regulatory domain-containing protein, partial [Planctomycetaceae bacterium]